jgi:probable blue pigment (indigoidine) exporter
MLASTAAFAGMSMVVREVGKAIPPMELAFFRSALLAGVAGAALAGARARFSPDGSMMARSLFGFLGVCCFFHSASRLDAHLAALLAWTTPVFTFAFSIARGEAKPSARAWACCLSAFAGAVLAIGSGGAGGGGIDWIGIAAGVAGALFSALGYVALRQAAARAAPSATILCFGLVGMLVSAPAAASAYVAPEPAQWVAIAAVGLLAWAYQACVTRAYALESPAVLAPVSLLAPVWVLLAESGWLGRMPGPGAVAGTLLIVAGLRGLTAPPAHLRAGAVAR